MSNDNLLPPGREDAQSQVPALRQLAALGYKILTPEKVKAERKGSFSSVLLEGILEKWLRENNRVSYQGEELPFTAGAISSAIQELKKVDFEGLGRESEKVYDLLILGKAFEQSVRGEVKSYTLRYVDFENPERNVFHAAYEFEVTKRENESRRRPDIVLFVNGIPFGVIECKSDLEKVDQAISQHLRNQQEMEIPELYRFVQIALAVNRRDGSYGTAGTAKSFWANWQEQEISDLEISATINQALPPDTEDAIFSDSLYDCRRYFSQVLQSGKREVTGQDRLIQAMCRPDRLLELTKRFILFDAGVKKVARYQQYFTVKALIDRVKERGRDGRRTGGVIWHTQGSGKSLTMVMLANCLAQDPEIKNPRIVLVTDRVDLDDQLCNTFRHCDKNPVQAKTGEHLLQLVKDGEEVITTVIDKFEAAMKKRDASDDSEDIFILVDEGHRSQYGLKNTRMQKVFPRACFIGFTGTPIMSGDKDTAMKFGGIVRPAYTMREAVMDGAVVPLLYEGRDVSKSVQEEPLDEGFGRVSEELSEYQKGQLKNQASRKEFLSANKQDVHLVAQDITDHFVEFWKDTGFKGQIVAFSKVVALELKASLDEIGKVTSEVVISPPDDREGHKDHFSGPTDEVQKFWASMMSRFGNEKSYNESVINAFKSSEDPELIIVVDKLLTGFDAPRNTVLYLYRSLKEHSLLQAIARVNRLHPGKDYGYVIDYWGVLGNLDKAMSEYDALKGFDEEDLHDTLTNLADEVRNLPQKHSDLWDVFKSIGNKSDKEAFELFLGDEEEREIFLKRLNQYGRCLANAKQSVAYLDELNDKKRNRFEKDLKFFQALRKSVRARYSEDIDFKDYEARIQRLLDSYVTATGVEQITKQVNIFDKENFAKELDNLESVASRADTIAHRTAKSINERMEEDPAFFSPLSKMIKDAIKAFQQKRISDAEYLEKATEVMDKVTNRSGDNLPDALANNEEARPYYGIFKQVAGICLDENDNKEEISADLGLQIESIISNNKVRDWQKNKDCQNNMKNDIEDALLEASKREGFKISFEQIDEILERSIRAAIVRDGGAK